MEIEASWRSGFLFLFAWKQLDARDEHSNTPNTPNGGGIPPHQWSIHLRECGHHVWLKKRLVILSSLPIPEPPSAICFSYLYPFYIRSQCCFQRFLKTKMQIQRNTEEEKKCMLWERIQHQVHG